MTNNNASSIAKMLMSYEAEEVARAIEMALNDYENLEAVLPLIHWLTKLVDDYRFRNLSAMAASTKPYVDFYNETESDDWTDERKSIKRKMVACRNGFKVFHSYTWRNVEATRRVEGIEEAQREVKSLIEAYLPIKDSLESYLGNDEVFLHEYRHVRNNLMRQNQYDAAFSIAKIIVENSKECDKNDYDAYRLCSIMSHDSAGSN